jgi:glycosyltransferase 2 family protein
MSDWFKRWGKKTARLVLAILILVAVGRRFYLDLRELDIATLSMRPGWLIASAVLYVLALGCWAGFWHALLKKFGKSLSLAITIKAYYVSHLGKYVPGKALTLILRAVLVEGSGVSAGMAAITAFYEVLTTMASGALLAAAVCFLQPPEVTGWPLAPAWLALGMAALVCFPLLPPVFNFFVKRLANRFPNIMSLDSTLVGSHTLVQGLLVTAAGWLLMGIGLWAALAAVLPEPAAPTPPVLIQCTGALSLAYVAGFLALVVPGGVGVREFLLLLLLQSLGEEKWLALAVLVARLTWTFAEALVAAAVFRWRAGTQTV